MSEIIEDPHPGTRDFSAAPGARAFLVPAFSGDRTAPGSPHQCCTHCTHLERIGHSRPCPRCAP